MRTLLAAAACACALAGVPGRAEAIDRHERPRLLPLKDPKTKKTVGVKVRMTLYPETYGRVRIGLGSAGKLPAATGTVTYQDKRALGAGVKKGYLRARLGELKGLPLGKPKEVEVEVRYGKKNDLKPGETVDVVTAWNASPTGTRGYWHIFGMTNGPVQSGPTYKLPK